MFIVYGPGITDPIHLDKLLLQPDVAQVKEISPKQAIQQCQITPHSKMQAQGRQSLHHHRAAERSYNQSRSLKASQIMNTPVFTIQSESAAIEALALLDAKGIRHIPVLSSGRQLVGVLPSFYGRFKNDVWDSIPECKV